MILQNRLALVRRGLPKTSLCGALLGSVALAQPSPDRINVRLEIDGRPFVGQLAAEPIVAPATQPAAGEATQDPPEVQITGGDAPFVVHLTGSDTIEPSAVHDTRIRWDFGDPAGRFNAIAGFNAAHVYDTPGTYVITRTIQTPAGTQTARVALEVKPAARTVLYVAADGDDRADGTSPQKAVKSWSRVVAALHANNVEIRFRRGDTFPIDRAVQIRSDNVRLTSFGDADKPRPTLVVERQLPATFTFECTGKRLMIDGLTFDATYFGNDTGKANLPDLFRPSGDCGLTVRGCEFRNVNTVVNGNGQPRGVLIQDNEAPLETGLRSYFAWIEGANWTILGNRVANSTREHICRVGGVTERVNIQFNDFANLDRSTAATKPDKSDSAKAALNIQKGSLLYAAHNTLRGANGVGPLGQGDGLKDKEGRYAGAVIEGNRVDGFFAVNHGASNIVVRDNVIRADDAIAFPVGGYAKEFGRGTDHVWIEHNTVINNGTRGSFVVVQAGATDLHLNNNLYVAPNLITGAYEAAAVYAHEPDLRAFAEIRNNVWPVGKPTGWAQSGVHYLASTWGEQSGYRDPTEWAAMRPTVDGDRFENVTDLSVVQSAAAGVTSPELVPAAKP